jgi:hypothetical protein
MNSREKTLIFVLFGVAFFVINIFLFTSFQSAMQKKRSQLDVGAKKLKLMEADLATWESKADDVEWLMNNQPVVGVHGNIGAELAAYTEKVANKHGVSLSKRPSPQRADTEETGAYRSARAKVVANAMDGQLYNWLVELQDPELNRAITFLRISPQRDDPTRVDCELEVTQWFRPEIEEESVVAE